MTGSKSLSGRGSETQCRQRRRLGKISRGTAISISVISLIAIGGLIWRNRTASETSQRNVLIPALNVKQRTHVHALGRLEPAGTVLQLSARSGNEGATVEKLFVKEGDDVREGDVLAVLDNHSRREAACREADARRDAAQARLKQIEAGAKTGEIEAQKAAVRLIQEQSRVAERELTRARDLLERKAIAREQADEKQWEYDRLQLEQRRSQGVLSALQEIRDVDVHVARMDVQAAQAAADRARAELDASELRAPSAGRILRIVSRPGEKISEKGIMELGDVSRMEAVAEVFEADVTLLRLKMTADVIFDASGDRMTGVVSEIGNQVARKVVLTNDPVSDTDARVVEVRVRLDDQFMERVARLSNARVEIHIRLEDSGPADSNSPSFSSSQTAIH